MGGGLPLYLDVQPVRAYGQVLYLQVSVTILASDAGLHQSAVLQGVWFPWVLLDEVGNNVGILVVRLSGQEPVAVL